MFLVTKYEWLKHSHLEESVLKEYFGERPSIQDVIDDANEWLLEIFNGSPYDKESLKILKQRPNLIADFTCYELFAENGVIKIVFPIGTEDKKKKKYEFVTACWLVYMDSIKRENGLTLNKYIYNFFNNRELKSIIIRFFNSVSPQREPWIGIPFDNKVYRYDDIDELARIIEQNIMKMSFTFKNPNPNMPVSQYYTINGSSYFPNDPECIQLEIRVNSFEDQNIQSYADYIQYLMKQKRNGICDFRNSRTFWADVVQLPRKHENLEEHAQQDKILLILTLALGLGTTEYKKLQTLRDNELEQHLITTIRTQKPDITEQEKDKLYVMIRESHWRILEARRQILRENSNETKSLSLIPRRMLFNANKELLLMNNAANSYHPIIELYNDEPAKTINAMMEEKGISRKTSEQILNRFYTTANNGNRIFR